MADIPEQEIRVSKGSDWTRYIRVLDGAAVQLSQDASASPLTLAPDHPAIASADKLLFGENIILTTSGACAAGATSLAVSSVPGPLKAKAVGRRIVKDLSGYELEFRVFVNRGDTTAQFTLTEGSGVTAGDDATDPAGSGKADIVQVSGDEANTTGLDAGNYFWALWRADEGYEKPLAQGPFILEEAGYVA